MKKIKILVGYHKKDKLYKNDIMVPIHCGRVLATEASKDGKISQEDYNWLLENMIGDDTGENISNLNRSINEMTAIYWAWKNYDKLGNPDYIGLNHYRRFFDIPYSKINKILDKYDFIKTPHGFTRRTFYEKWNFGENSKDFLKSALDICKKINPDEGAKIEQFFHGHIGKGWCNMFVLPKEDFFEYCNFMFSIILNLPNDTKYGRLAGMFAERLTSYYLYNLSLKKRAKSASIIDFMQYSSKEFFLKHIFNIEQIKRYDKIHTIISILGIKLKFNIG
ncbi:DUF4422 domain-containing protein [bacterium]|nr:DUF4422 domain-containing protein [bacterium]